MPYKDFITLLIFSFFKKFKFSSLFFFLDIFEENKKFFKIENFLKINGFLGSKILKKTLCSLFLIKRLFFFFLKTKKRISEGNSVKTIKIFHLLNKSTEGLSFFLSKLTFLKPENLGQFTLVEGKIKETSLPFIKKVAKKNFIENDFSRKSKLSKNLNSNSNFSISEDKEKKNFFLINYQEILIRQFLPQSFNEILPKLSEMLVFLVNSMVERIKTGMYISIVGIVKKRQDLKLNTRDGNFSVKYIIEAVYMKLKKLKNPWEKINLKKRVRIIDFKSPWQDLNPKNFGVFSSDLILINLFRTSRITKFSKLLVLICLVGRFNIRTRKNGRGNFSDCLILRRKKFEKNYLTNLIYKFWTDSFLINSEKNAKRPNLPEMKKKCDKTFLKKSMLIHNLTRGGIFFIIDNFMNEKIGANSFLDKKTSVFLNFVKNREKITNHSSTFFSIYKLKELNFLKNENSRFKLEKNTSKEEFGYFWKNIFSFFDFFLITKKFYSKIVRKNSPYLSEKRSQTIYFSQEVILNHKKKNQKLLKSDLRSFFFFSKTFSIPKLSKKAQKFLISIYTHQNQKKPTVSSSILNMEKIIRISEGYSRFLFQDNIQINHCVFSIFVLIRNFYIGKNFSEFFEVYSKFDSSFFLTENLMLKKLGRKFYSRTFKNYQGLCAGNFYP